MKRSLLLLVVAFTVNSILPAQVVIQRCDVTTGWQGTQTISVDQTDKKEGKGSLLTEAQSDVSVWFEKSFSSTQTGMTSTGYLSFWLYVSDASKLNGGEIEISSSAGPDNHELHWPLSKDDVVNGWNLMQLQIRTPETADSISGTR